MKTKIDLSRLSAMTIKEFQADTQREFKRLMAYGQATNIVVLTDFTFQCGNIGAMLIIGDLNSELQKFYKEQKTARTKEKDFAIGNCLFLDNKIYIDLTEGAAKVSDLEKGLKKTKINLETIITKNAGLPKPIAIHAKADIAPEKSPKASPIDKIDAAETALLKQLEEVKALFQKIKLLLPNIQAGKSNAEDLKVFSTLQQHIQQWFALYNNSNTNLQVKLKEQAIKLKEQYTKIAALVQKNKV